ncbi:LicD family protein [Weissella coleopterorum]|uniref:LicD family protein n=1 Tax=Weissella coleopterorum TaxID=2714949 RepID=A0A6G8B0R1_9LACO|nr:LicD family protein [Weissella coleopterorum]QIL50809.1 LicD family protein [Weissella coleopterorum]
MDSEKEYINITEIQKIMLDILRDVITFCNNNDYHYILTGGSALGATRHKGFIPWDDDMDIALPRNEYEQFIHKYQPQYSNLVKLNSENTKNWLYPYTRISDSKTVAEGRWAEVQNGVYVDIFPIDAISGNKTGQIIGYLKMKYLDVMRNSTRRIAISKEEPFWWLKPLLIKFAKRKSTGEWVNKMERLAQKSNRKHFNYSNAFSLFVVQGLNKRRENFNKDMYFKRNKAVFEGESVFVPGNVNQYLTQMYGNWENIPNNIEKKTHARFYRKGI